METKELTQVVVNALEDLKAQEVTVLDVKAMTTVTDTMIIASGTSNRHVQSLANNVVVKAKAGGEPPIGIEGEGYGEWILVDLGNVLVHVMLPKVRDFYNLEKLWNFSATTRKARLAER